MTQLIRIGNSQGVRIPKALIQQAGLEEAELEFSLVEEGLLIKPVRPRPRQDWEKRIREVMQQYGSEEIDREWLDAPLSDDSEWEWQDEAV
ncbi:MAG: AbrB/MazE/SpoVT family DNA-binding domain-containing protein [Anaerolinea sp.]|nr:AbrB/MazE/SpoVT family DNA-binding domain-containing protein [Anaerolinea sp.]